MTAFMGFPAEAWEFLDGLAADNTQASICDHSTSNDLRVRRSTRRGKRSGIYAHLRQQHSESVLGHAPVLLNSTVIGELGGIGDPEIYGLTLASSAHELASEGRLQMYLPQSHVVA